MSKLKFEKLNVYGIDEEIKIGKYTFRSLLTF
jgi:hypothetical protein